LSERKDRLEREIKRKTILKIVLIFVLLLIVVGMGVPIGRHVLTVGNKLQREVIVVKSTVLDDTLPCKALVLHVEHVVIAQHAGELENLVREQEKVRGGSLVGYLQGYKEKTPLYAPTPGMITVRTDGLEEVLQGLNLKTLGPEVFTYKSVLRDGKTVEKGDFVLKIVDNLVSTRLALEIPSNKLTMHLKKDQSIEIILNSKQKINATLQEFEEKGENTFIIIQLDDFYTELIYQRFPEVQIVQASYLGCLIPETALAEQNGEKGVFCVKGEDLVFKKVKLVKIMDKELLVEGLEENVMILSNSSAR
jgi:putative membrane fusion protein